MRSLSAIIGWTGLVLLAATIPRGVAGEKPSASGKPIRTGSRMLPRDVPADPNAAKTPEAATLSRSGRAVTGLKGASPDSRSESSNRQTPGAQSATIVDPAATDDEPLKFLLEANVTPIDLYSALRLAGENNPEVIVAQQRVVEAVALRQLAAAQFLPTINLGTSYDLHRGVLQQSSGNILSVQRDALFVGAGASAIAAGTVNIPGVMWNLNLSESIYNYLVTRVGVDRQAFERHAVEQDTLLEVASAYTELLKSEALRSVAVKTREDIRELARMTAAYAKTGEGRQADADRAATELARRDAEVRQVEGRVLSASARLSKVLHLDPSMRLHATESYLVPRSIVPEPIPLEELLTIALLNRPELHARRAAITQALLNLESARLLPFSPTLFIGFSAGGFGGGSNLAAEPTGTTDFARGQPRFGAFGARQDLDVMAYWTLLNMGVGNKAQIQVMRSRMRAADLEQWIELDRVRSEVASARARVFARFARIRSCELAIQSSTLAFEQDMLRVKGHEGLPLEATDSFRLLARSRQQYLDAIAEYNTAQFEFYVALGKPPAEALIRPADESEPNPVPPEPAQNLESR